MDTTLSPFPSAVVVADTSDMTRTEWLTERRRGIGGSDAAAIVGMSRWQSPFECYLDKTGGLGDSDEACEAAEWGVLLEPLVRTRSAQKLDVVIEERNVLLAHRDRLWQLANLDGDIPELDAVYEGKTASAWLASEWADDGIPDSYVLQAQHYLAVTGRARCVFGVLIGGQRHEVRTVERDQDLIDHLISLEAEFWWQVENLTPPQPDGSKACTDLLAHLYDVAPGLVRTVAGAEFVEVEQLLADRAAAVADEKAAGFRKTEAENRLKAICAEAEVLATPAGTPVFTWKEQSRRGFDTKALQAAHPEIAAEFETVSTFRKIHIPKRKAV